MLTPARARGGNSPWPPSSEWLNKTAYDVMEYDSAFKKKEILTHGKCRGWMGVHISEGPRTDTYTGRWLLKAEGRGTGSDNVGRSRRQVMGTRGCPAVCMHSLPEPTKKINLIWYVFLSSILFSKWTTYPAVFMPLPFPERHLKSCARPPRAKSTLPELDLSRLASPSQLATLLRPCNRLPFAWPSSQFSIYLSRVAVGTHNISWAVNYELGEGMDAKTGVELSDRFVTVF